MLSLVSWYVPDVTAVAMDGEKLDMRYLVGIYPDIRIFDIIGF